MQAVQTWEHHRSSILLPVPFRDPNSLSREGANLDRAGQRKSASGWFSPGWLSTPADYVASVVFWFSEMLLIFQLADEGEPPISMILSQGWGCSHMKSTHFHLYNLSIGTADHLGSFTGCGKMEHRVSVRRGPGILNNWYNCRILKMPWIESWFFKTNSTALSIHTIAAIPPS